MSSSNNFRILFLARRYPPSVGGIQTHCYNLYHRLIEMCSVKLVALGRDSLLHLVWFCAILLFRVFFFVFFSGGLMRFILAMA